jgi:hypothetical protein
MTRAGLAGTHKWLSRLNCNYQSKPIAQNDDSMNLKKHWRAFLQKNSDAQMIVNRVAERTGLHEDEVLLYLLGMWAARNLAPEQNIDGLLY